MTNIEQIEEFEETVHEAVHKLFNSLPDRFEAHDLKDILGIMQFEIFHIWLEAQDKMQMQTELERK